MLDNCSVLIYTNLSPLAHLYYNKTNLFAIEYERNVLGDKWIFSKEPRILIVLSSLFMIYFLYMSNEY